MALKIGDKIGEKTDLEARVRKLERMELRLMTVERNIYYTIGAIFGMLLFVSALFIPLLGRFSALGLTWAGTDPIATASHVFIALFFISMVVSFYKGIKLESEIPE